jgi:hypothetical protein
MVLGFLPNATSPPDVLRIVSVSARQAGRGWLKFVVCHNPPLDVRT